MTKMAQDLKLSVIFESLLASKRTKKKRNLNS